MLVGVAQQEKEVDSFHMGPPGNRHSMPPLGGSSTPPGNRKGVKAFNVVDHLLSPELQEAKASLPWCVPRSHMLVESSHINVQELREGMGEIRYRINRSRRP